MAIHYTSDDISLFSFKKELTSYSWGTFRQDAMAAFSVALLTVPQAMAYALLAGLPLSCGLLSAIYSSMVAALFGSSRHLIVGPSNAIAILVQSVTAEIMFTYYRDMDGVNQELVAIQVLSQLVLLVSVMQILAAGCKLGRLTQFVSHSVMIGYLAGTAMAMVVSQLYTFLGVTGMLGEHSLYEKSVYLITHLQQSHWPTALVGVGSLIVLLVFRHTDKRIPVPLIMLVLAGVAVHLMHMFFADFSVDTEGAQLDRWGKVLLVGDTGEFTDIWPRLSLPFFDIRIMNHLLPVAFAIALLSVLETISVSKSLAANSGQHLSMNQEIFGSGLGNLLSAFLFAMPVAGSASRSSISYANGAQTRFAAVLNGVCVALVLLCFNSLIMHIPLAALSALLLVTAANIVNPRQFFLCLKATSSDAFVLWITTLSCIFFSLDIAFYIGVIISITLYLKKAAIPQLVEYDIDDAGELHNLNSMQSQQHKTIRVIKVEGELFFGAADLFQRTLKAFAEDDTSTRVIILQLKNARDIDATGCLALQQLCDYMKSSGRHLLACGITQQIWDVLSNSGMVAQLGKENLFVFDERHPHMYMLRAMQRARAIILDYEEGLKASAEMQEILEQPSAHGEASGEAKPLATPALSTMTTEHAG